MAEMEELPSTAVEESPAELAKTDAGQSNRLNATLESFDQRPQPNRLETTLDRLNATLESFKVKAQSTDKKTAFWTVYNKLADEFDKEFQAKYGGDLDTGLIFAGLFFAISAAFIIQNMMGVADPAPMPTQTGPAMIVVVVQSLSYFSLLTTLLAALLAVLGK
ncbi:hypothetical protein DFH09DRAFT_1365629 [Mycena vulgaris]|nr:hypothetical protein DFH09DRAFT_1365629 [Mycena vulgaris]